MAHEKPCAARIPIATYRLQFNSQFTFADARAVIPYLHDLGISDIYASSFVSAKEGSLHGYDIVDPTTLNAEIGTEQEFRELVEELHHFGMGQIGAFRDLSRPQGGDHAAGIRSADSRLREENQNRPTVLPASSTSIAKAAGDFPRPGIVCMSPQSATIHPAPVYGRRSRTVTVEDSGRCVQQGRVVGEREVRLRHADRRLPSPAASSDAALSFAVLSMKTSSAP